MGTIQWLPERSRLPGLAVGLGEQRVIKPPARLRIREAFNQRGKSLPDLCESDQEAVFGKVSEFGL